jgi:hypothetical protein
MLAALDQEETIETPADDNPSPLFSSLSRLISLVPSSLVSMQHHLVKRFRVPVQKLVLNVQKTRQARARPTGLYRHHHTIEKYDDDDEYDEHDDNAVDDDDDDDTPVQMATLLLSVLLSWAPPPALSSSFDALLRSLLHTLIIIYEDTSLLVLQLFIYIPLKRACCQVYECA